MKAITYLTISHWHRSNIVGNLRITEVFCQSSNGRTFYFSEPAHIQIELLALEKLLHKKVASLKNLNDLVDILATFWFFFLAIHPYANGNRKTAEKVITEITFLYGIKDFNFTHLRKFIFSNFEEDYSTLCHLFLSELRIIA